MTDSIRARVDDALSPPAIEYPRRYNAAAEFLDPHTALGRGEKPALIDSRGAHSYAELTALSHRAGNLLRSLGVEPEQRVLVCMHDSVELAALFWGGLKAGIVIVPLNTLLTQSDYRYIVEDSRARALVVSADLVEKFAPVVDRIETVVVAGEASDHLELATALAGASEDLDPAPTTPDDVAFWLYTSGSTGPPKAAMHLHRDLLYTAVHYAREVLAISEQDVVFSAAKMFFAYGLGNSLTFPMFAGATAVVLAERPTPEAVLGIVERHRPSLFFGVPTLYAGLLAATTDADRSRFASVRLCVSAGEALPEDLGERWQARFGTEIVDGLGSTEMLHIFLSNRPGRVRYGTTGTPLPGYAVRLIDETGADVPAGEVGELIVSGGSAAMAYWNQREKSLATFRGPWTHTGDRYVVSPDGYYRYAGRGDDMLKVGGIWVSPFEVESALIEHPAVLEAAVVGQADADGLIKPKAFVVVAPDHRVEPGLASELQAFVKTRLAPFKYPRWVEFIDELPKTATGKIQRFKLR